jgi:hypothetical protein
MKLKFKVSVSVFLILIFFFIITSCGKSSSPANPLKGEIEQVNTDKPSKDSISKSDLVNLLITDDLTLSEDLILEFYKYYRLDLHLHELAMLPSFNSAEQLDWDQFTIYIYLLFAQQNNFNPTLTKEDFKKVTKMYFGEIEYIDQESHYLTYTNGIYTVKAGDTMRNGYYRLIDISKDTSGIYTAVFDGLFFDELESSEPYEEATSNIKAIRDAAGTTEPIQLRDTFEKTIQDIFLKEDYAKVLNMTEKVVIQFTLSGDDDFPFIYLSCNITNY